MERATLVGIFPDRSQAERCVEELRRNGFRDDQIGFMMQDQSGRATTSTGSTMEHEGSHDHDGDVSAGEGALTGAITGGLVGAAAALFIPAVGPILAGGILASTLAGAAIGAVTGGIAAALIDLGVPEDEANYYEGEVKSGRILVTVKTDGRYNEAHSIMENYGAYFDETGARTGYADTGMGERRAPMTDEDRLAERRAARTGMTGETTTGEGRTLELREEELRARKTPVQTGEVQVHKEVVTENHTIEVPVKHEEVVVERRPVNRPAGDVDLHDTNETIRIPVSEEQVSLDKRAVVREEVEIGKRETVDTERVSGEVRREEARIDRSGDVDLDDDAVSANERLRQQRLDQERRSA